LRPGIQPAPYLEDTCAYLRLRWGEGKAEPGTVVVPVMFHSIVTSPSKPTDPKDITVEDFIAFVDYARLQGFETITTQQLSDFLLYNAPIPPRSMLLIVDDRRPGLIFEHFMPVLDANDWTVTSAYIADPDSMDWAWKWMERLNESGRLDVQSHGYTGQLYVLPDTPLEDIQHEIWDSTLVLEQHFGKTPIAFIWPGGNFTPTSAHLARQGGYQLGFTAYSRGPLLFNWIPLGEEERLVNDPLMVLPRAWSNSVNYNLDEAVRVSQQAAAFAEANAQLEKDWLQTYCADVSPE
jgi:peptidoglycan/xylan/chitin deacetylase (PgdA/CDA1 family)